MIKLLILLGVFTVTISCSRDIITKDGIVEIDRSFKPRVVSKSLIETITKEERRGCTKCGMCLTYDGSFGFSCLCSGQYEAIVKYDFYSVVYDWVSEKRMTTHRALPVQELETKILESGNCN